MAWKVRVLGHEANDQCHLLPAHQQDLPSCWQLSSGEHSLGKYYFVDRDFSLEHFNTINFSRGSS